MIPVCLVFFVFLTMPWESCISAFHKKHLNWKKIFKIEQRKLSP